MIVCNRSAQPMSVVTGVGKFASVLLRHCDAVNLIKTACAR